MRNHREDGRALAHSLPSEWGHDNTDTYSMSSTTLSLSKLYRVDNMVNECKEVTGIKIGDGNRNTRK
jgi:hypothetical protein